MAGAWWAWLLALALYGLFRWWYDNWQGPLTASEIDAFLAGSGQTTMGEHTDLAALRKFLVADHGREFIMTNHVRVHPNEVPHPAASGPTQRLPLLPA